MTEIFVGLLLLLLVLALAFAVIGGPILLLTVAFPELSLLFEKDPQAGNVRVEPQESESLATLVGAHGVTHTALRLEGTIRVAGNRYSAISRDGWIEPGVPVKIIGLCDSLLEVVANEMDVSA